MKRQQKVGVLIFSGILLAFVTFLVTPGGALDRVALRLDWIGYQPHHIAFWIAKDKGWYGQRGDRCGNRLGARVSSSGTTSHCQEGHL